MYISTTTQLVTNGLGPAVWMQAGVPTGLPPALVELALAQGAKAVAEKKTRAKTDPESSEEVE